MTILGLHILDAILILVYFIGLIFIGVIVSYQIKNQEDFLVGGRKIGTFLQTFMNFGMATGSDVPVGAAREHPRPVARALGHGGPDRDRPRAPDRAGTQCQPVLGRVAGDGPERAAVRVVVLGA